MYTGEYDDGRLQAGSTTINPPENSSTTQGTSKSFDSASASYLGSCAPQALVTNAKVLVCADKWDIPKLRELSVRKYKECLAHEGKDNSFLSSFELMFGDWPEEDGGLKATAMKHAVKHYTELVQLPAFGEMCRKNGEIGLRILEGIAGPKVSVPPLTAPTHLTRLKSCPDCSRFSTGPDTWVHIHPDSQGIYRCTNCGARFS